MDNLSRLRDAQRLVADVMPPTPLHPWPQLSQAAGCDVRVKHENHTPIGAFKLRGGLVYFEYDGRDRRVRLREEELVTDGVGPLGFDALDVQISVAFDSLDRVVEESSVVGGGIPEVTGSTWRSDRLRASLRHRPRRR